MVGIQRFLVSDGRRKLELKCTLEFEEVDGLMVVTRSKRSNTDGWILNCRFSDFKVDPELDPDQFLVETDDD